ncbi:MAG: hypothetical protein K0S61_4336 [Anaerocolumna sp.]|jgi:hypothetical protein|nr:hypothetical protein [Anaerocolumna sp.]
MNNEEFLSVASGLRAAYPNSNFLTTKDSIAIWYDMLKDIDIKIFQYAAKEYISTGKFPPSIADIREKCTGYTQIPIGDWSEAWETVFRAIRKFGYMQELDALGSMDEITQTCVKRLGYQNICMSENITADRANFREIYEAEAKRRKEQGKIPLQLQEQRQQMIGQLIENTVQQIENKEEPVIEKKEANMGMVSKLLNGLRRN